MNVTKQFSRSQTQIFENSSLFEGIEINCSQGSKGFAYCIQCASSGVLCRNESCLCYSKHKKCTKTKRISTFNQSLEKKRKPTKVKTQIEKLCLQMIDRISLMEGEIKLRLNFFGLSQADKKIVQQVKSYAEGSAFKNNIFQTYQNSKTQSQQCWFSQQIRAYSSIVDSVKEYLNKKLQSLKDSIYQEHLQNSNNKNKQFFCDSLILQKKQNESKVLVDMFKPLGQIIKVQKVFFAQDTKFSTREFLKSCPGKSNLLYLVQNENDLIYGGYCPRISPTQAITRQRIWIYQDTKKESFIFDLQQKIRSNVVNSEKNILTFYGISSSQELQSNNKENRQFLVFGDTSFPNLVISENSKQIERLNYIQFKNKDQNNPYFQKKNQIRQLVIFQRNPIV